MKSLRWTAFLAVAGILLSGCGRENAGTKEYTAYLFAHMTHSNYGHLYYSVSRDAVEWETLNEGKVILDGYLGHPNIVRAEACGRIREEGGPGECFYMLGVTTEGDLRDPVLWYSRDLVSWNHLMLRRDIFDVSALGYENESVYLGAPKIFYDEDNSRYMVTWHAFKPGIQENNPRWESMRTFYVLTSDWENFTDAERIFDFDGDDASMATIDAIFYKEGEKYYAVIKDERWPETSPSGKTIRIASSDSLTGPYCNPGESVTGAWEEAPVAVRKNDGGGWYLFTERYLQHRYCAYETESLSSGKWNSAEVSFPDQGRHGCVIPITEKEYLSLTETFRGNIGIE